MTREVVKGLVKNGIDGAIILGGLLLAGVDVSWNMFCGAALIRHAFRPWSDEQ